MRRKSGLFRVRALAYWYSGATGVSPRGRWVNSLEVAAPRPSTGIVDHPPAFLSPESGAFELDQGRDTSGNKVAFFSSMAPLLFERIPISINEEPRVNASSWDNPSVLDDGSSARVYTGRERMNK